MVSGESYRYILETAPPLQLTLSPIEANGSFLKVFERWRSFRFLIKLERRPLCLGSTGIDPGFWPNWPQPVSLAVHFDPIPGGRAKLRGIARAPNEPCQTGSPRQPCRSMDPGRQVNHCAAQNRCCFGSAFRIDRSGSFLHNTT